MTASDQLLEVCDLGHVYPGEVQALQGVQFRARKGEFIAVLGASGSGKTTLLRHFNGALRPTSGRVVLEGRDLAREHGQWVYRTVGFVFQDPNDQLFALTVGEDVAFGPRNAGLPAPEVSVKVSECLALVGLAGYQGRPIASLSFGQRRRVAIAGVLAMDPKIMVLDEPTSGLDPRAAGGVMGLLQSLCRRRGTTVIVATHDVDLVPPYIDRVHVLDNGRVVLTGTPADVFAHREALRSCGLRLPRAAEALGLLSRELGSPLLKLPMTMDKEAISFELECDDVFPGGKGGEASAKSGLTIAAAAAAAARAAAELVLWGQEKSAVELRTPLGAVLLVPVASIRLLQSGVAESVVVTGGTKGDGDDPGQEMHVHARVEVRGQRGVAVDGGAGVGRITRPGLPMAVGGPAISPLTRQMIADAVGDLLEPGQGLEVVVSVPGGEDLAGGTVDTATGIEGGIAIWGVAIGAGEDLK